MARGVTALFIGTKHAIVAAVSAMTLRDHWSGPVSWFCDETAMPFATPICRAAGINLIRYEPVKQRRNSGYMNKTTLPSLSPYQETVQLDLDTVIVGTLDGLWPEKDDEWVLTPFAHWLNTGNIVGGRIKKWRNVAPKLVADKQKLVQPALNTGIMAYGSDCWLAKYVWREVTSLNPAIFISDETAADLITGQPEWLQHVRLLDQRYNWSPMYSDPMEDRRVLHIHGPGRHVRDGWSTWSPYYVRAYEENFGGIREWLPQCGDKHFHRFAAQHTDILGEFS